jgi:hypothetical protein
MLNSSPGALVKEAKYSKSVLKLVLNKERAKKFSYKKRKSNKMICLRITFLLVMMQNEVYDSRFGALSLDLEHI